MSSEKSQLNKQVQCTLPNAEGQAVSVCIDSATAQTLLQQFREVFAWRIQLEIAPEHAHSTNEVAPTDSEIADDLQTFAQSVLQFADLVVPAGRFGDHYVFINHAWRAWQNAGSTLGLEPFKRRLVQAHHAGYLKLGCAALAHTLNAVDLLQSEAKDEDNANYHFIVLAEAGA